MKDNDLLLVFAAMWAALFLCWYAMSGIMWAVDVWRKRRG